MAGWSWFAPKQREAPPARRAAVTGTEPGTVRRGGRPSTGAYAVDEDRCAPAPTAGASPDAHLRRALALVELSRLVLDEE